MRRRAPNGATHSRKQRCPTAGECGLPQSLSTSKAMRYSLRKTPSHLHLAYKYGEASDGLLGRNFTLEVQDRMLTLSIDLTPNFHTRNKSAAAYLDAVTLARNHHKLRFLQCSDNLVRTRLIRAWEQVQNPELRLCLELGQRGHFLYAVQPHSLFTGGIQFDVEEALDQHVMNSHPQMADAHPARHHA